MVLGQLTVQLQASQKARKLVFLGSAVPGDRFGRRSPLRPGPRRAGGPDLFRQTEKCAGEMVEAASQNAAHKSAPGARGSAFQKVALRQIRQGRPFGRPCSPVIPIRVWLWMHLRPDLPPVELPAGGDGTSQPAGHQPGHAGVAGGKNKDRRPSRWHIILFAKNQTGLPDFPEQSCNILSEIPESPNQS